MSKKVKLLVGGVVAATVVVGVAVSAWPDSGPRVDQALRAQITPLIQRHLEEKRATADGTAASAAEPGSRLFCEVHVIEARERQGNLQAGVQARCEEYARRGDALVPRDGFGVPMLVTLAGSGDARRVVGVQEPQEKESVHTRAELRRLFTEAGTAELHRRAQQGHEAEGRRLQARARRAFGLPADARVRD